MHIKEREGVDPASVWVAGDGSDVLDPDTSAVVRLEHNAILDIKVVVNGTMVGRFEGAGLVANTSQ